jgi:hypothetical protein
LPAELVEADREARFFGSIKAADGTFKRTIAGRLAVIDEAIVAALADAQSQVASVLDIGISSGITALELHQALRRAGHPARLTGTDRLIEASILKLFPGCRALIDSEGFPLQYEIGGRPVRPWTRRLDYFTGAVLPRTVLNRVLTDRIRRLRATSPASAQPVKLVTRRLVADDAVTVVSDDITRLNPGFVGQFDFVRAANILNLHYFDGERLRTALANVRAYLKGPGAWLLVLRTHGRADHHGTLFRQQQDGSLAVTERYGGGSEVESLLMS